MGTRLRRLLRDWGDRRLSLAGLTTIQRAVAAACLVVLALECGLLLAKAIGVDPPGGFDVIPAAGRAARVAVILVYLGLAFASAAIGLAARDLARWRLGAVLLALALPALALAGQTVFDARLEHGLTRAGFFGGATWWLTLGLAIVAAIISVVALALIPCRPTSRRDATIVAAVALPFLLCMLAYLVASTEPARASLRTTYPNLPESPRATIALAPANTTAAAGLLLSLVLLWQAAAGARAVVRDAGTRTQKLAHLFPLALGAVLVLKLVWVALGYAGWLPHWLAGDATLWHDSREAGWAWPIAALDVALLLAWLSRRRRLALSDRDVSRAVTAATGGFSALLAAAVTLIFLTGIWQGFWPGRKASPGLPSLVHANDWIGNQLLNWEALFVLLAALTAGTLLWLRRAHAFAVLLAAFAIWSTPRAIVIALEQTGLLHRSEHTIAAVDRVTLDTLITSGAAAILVWSLLTRRRQAMPLALLVAVSTLLAYGGRLTAAATGSNARLFYLGLIFPVVWSFAFDAGGLNQPSPNRHRKIFVATGLAAAGLAMLGLKVSTGAVAPGSAGGAELGHLLFVIPFAFVLIASVSPQPAHSSAPAPPVRPIRPHGLRRRKDDQK